MNIIQLSEMAAEYKAAKLYQAAVVTPWVPIAAEGKTARLHKATVTLIDDKGQTVKVAFAKGEDGEPYALRLRRKTEEGEWKSSPFKVEGRLGVKGAQFWALHDAIVALADRLVRQHS